MTPIKSPKVPNGVSKAKVTPKSNDSSVVGAGVDNKANGTDQPKTNGHIEANGTGAEKIIDVSAD